MFITLKTLEHLEINNLIGYKNGYLYGIVADMVKYFDGKPHECILFEERENVKGWYYIKFKGQFYQRIYHEDWIVDNSLAIDYTSLDNLFEKPF